MTTSKSGVSGRAARTLLTPAIVAIGVATFLDPFGLDPRDAGRLSATTPPSRDEDGDGLVLRQELILETLPSVADSDLDGYADAEELARNTSPILPQIHPTTNEVDLAITAHGTFTGLHAVIAVYVPDGQFDTLDLRAGILVGRRMIFLRPAMVMSGSIEYVPGAAPNSLVALVDFRFPREWVDATGHLTMFATVSQRGSGTNEAAAAMDLFNVDGVVVLAMPDPHFVPSQNITGGSSIGQGGTVYKPLTIIDGEPPPGWTLGEVCFQQSSTITISGAVTVQEISSAECQTGWEGACPSDCSSSVGSTYTTVDPSILVGG